MQFLLFIFISNGNLASKSDQMYTAKGSLPEITMKDNQMVLSDVSDYNYEIPRRSDMLEILAKYHILQN